MALALVLAIDSPEAVIKLHIVSKRIRRKLTFASIFLKVNSQILGLFLLSLDWHLHIQIQENDRVEAAARCMQVNYN